jgi:hypothetical protein
MRPSEREIQQRNHDADRQAIADDGERPRVARVSFVLEPAHLAALEVRAAREELTQAAVRALPGQSATKGGSNERRAALDGVPCQRGGGSPARALRRMFSNP